MLEQGKVFVLGNPIVREDNIAIEVAKRLRESFPSIAFEEIDSIDSIKELPQRLVFMDAVAGVEEPCIFTDLEKIRSNDVFSLHDLDAGFQLKLFKKMGKIKKVKIIAVPQKMELEKAVEGVARLLKKNGKMLF